MNQSFKIAISKGDFSKIDYESVNEYIKNSKDEMVLKGKKLTGSWIASIATKINEYEGVNYTMIGKNGRINRLRKLKSSKFFTATGILDFCLNIF